jgi:arsenite oxidase small subunit
MTELDPAQEKFKVVDPQIPGVPVAKKTATGATNAASLPVAVWLTIAIGAVLMVGASFFWWFSLASKRADRVAAEVAPAVVTPAAAPVAPVEKVALGPGEIGSTSEFPAPWSAKQFVMQDPVTKLHVPATVVKLPGGAYWAFSMIEPFGQCHLEYITDLKRLDSYYGFRASHPMVGDPCSKSVFDLTKYGPGIDGLVRGEMVRGSGLRPPMAIEVRVEGNKIVAVRME